MSLSPYSYKYRPYYFDPKIGQRGKLIEFFRGSNADGFVPIFFKAIGELNPIAEPPEEKWMLFETWIHFETPMGKGHIMIDDWDNLFLEGPLILLDKIDALLDSNPDWEKIPTVTKDYYLKKKRDGQDIN